MTWTKGTNQSAKYQNFDCSLEISPNLHFHRLLLLKLYKISVTKKKKKKKKNDNKKIKIKNNKLYGLFLWIGFNCLKARATSRRQFSFYY